jgi:alkylhydroperoxidase/carboxymuconolactone decarboxylase family protein YurZ
MACLHLGIAGTYAGAPVAVEGFRAAKEVFQELGI